MTSVKNEPKSNIVTTMFEPNHCDLYIKPEYPKQDNTVESVIVKNEGDNYPILDDEGHLSNLKTEFKNENNADNETNYVFNDCSSDESTVLDTKIFHDYDSKFQLSGISIFEPTETQIQCSTSNKSVVHLPMRLATNNVEKMLVTEVAEANEKQLFTDVNKEEQTEDSLIHIIELRTNLNKIDGTINEEYKTELEDNYHNHKGQHNTGKLICDICQKEFKWKSVLINHLRTHDIEKFYSCHLCKYRCVIISNLSRHMKTHTGEKPYSCNLCTYRSVQKSNLVGHMRTHTGEKPYSCHLCKYRCVQKFRLVGHMRTHTGEKPYSCNLCNYKCTNNKSLKLHMRVHTDKKPFTCDLCEYKCAYRAALAVHMRIHSEENPYSCHLCDYKCAHNTSLKSHMSKLCKFKSVDSGSSVIPIRTYGRTPLFCDLCEYKCTNSNNLARHKETHIDTKVAELESMLA